MSTPTPTSVVNIKHEACDLYIGRYMPPGDHMKARTPGDPLNARTSELFGNPFKITDHGPGEAVPLYRQMWRILLGLAEVHQADPRAAAGAAHLQKRFAADAMFWKLKLLELKGKRLGCWCKPAPCHGDVLVELIEELSGGEG